MRWEKVQVHIIIIARQENGRKTVGCNIDNMMLSMFVRVSNYMKKITNAKKNLKKIIKYF